MRCINLLLEAGASVSKTCRVKKGDTIGDESPLLLAISLNYDDSFLHKLVQAGSPDIVNEVVDGDTALTRAIDKKRYKTMTWLMDEMGADPQIRTSQSLLTKRILRYDKTPEADSMITRLIGMVDINDGGYGSEWQVLPISMACYNKHLNILKMLLGQGDILDIDKMSFRGDTALIVAAYHGWTAGVKLLLKTNRCDLNIRDRNGHTALDNARSNRNRACITALEASAVKYARDNE